LEEIAQGGMGAIWRVHDPQLGRELAVKVLRLELCHQPELVRRFLDEARITAQLPHPGIVPVHELAQDDSGLPFLAMKLVRGETLEALLQRRASPQEDLPRFLSIFEQVCQAVAFAHARGVIHRDLKPLNVMVGQFGEVQVMDWGVAKLLRPSDGAGEPPARNGGLAAPPGQAGGVTQAGTAVGTPGYMAPEQARGELDRIDRRSDVFGLGAILYQVLTGKQPFAGPDALEQLLHAAAGELDEAFARLEGCGADAGLVALARACLNPAPEQRPGDAAEVARRVADYQRGVQERLQAAERARAVAEARVWEERKRRRLAVAAVVLLALALAGGAAAWYQHDRSRRQAAERRQRGEAEAAAALRETDHHLREEPDLRDRDPERWHAAVQLAAAAVGRATAALANADVGPDWEDRVRQKAAEVDRQRRDSALRLELDRIRLEMAATRNGNFDSAAGAPRYQEALGKYGIDPADTAASARVVAGSPLRGELVAALTDWSHCTPDPREAKWLVALLEAVEKAGPAGQGQWHTRWVAAVRQGNGRALAALARQAGGELAAADVTNLARELDHLGQAGAAVELLRRGRKRLPDDFWLNHDLGMALHQQDPRSGEGVPYLMVAAALRPHSPGTQLNLGLALAEKGDVDDAIRCFRRAIELDPRYPLGHSNLGIALKERGHVEEAMRCYHTALELDPRFAPALTSLGVALAEKGDLDGAIRRYREALAADPTYAKAYFNWGVDLAARGDMRGATRCYEKAIDLNPRYAKAHANLGTVLLRNGDVDGAIRRYHRAIELDPGFAPVHNDLGMALKEKGDLDGAIRCYRKAIELDPKLAMAYDNLGNALRSKGDVDGAIRCHRQAIDLAPWYATAHTNLGLALQTKGDLDGAVRCFRKAIELSPRHPIAHAALGQVLLWRGQFGPARDATRRALDLLPLRDPQRGRVAQQLRRCEAGRALAEKLPAVLQGKASPANAAESLALAQLCQQSRQFSGAARLYAEAFASQHGLAEDMEAQPRYNAACCAALAATGEGNDASKLDAREHARLRGQVLAWLRADLDAWGKRLADAKPAQRQAILQTLHHWQEDADLQAVRDEKALAALPPRERDAWQKLWADVANLANKAGRPH
jgi:tetratricopeptide (TPR) repeat protein